MLLLLGLIKITRIITVENDFLNIGTIEYNMNK